MIYVRVAEPAELDEAKDYIQSIFPQSNVYVNDGDTVLFAEYEGRKVGFAHLIDMGERYILQGIGVESSMRGRGVGSMLMDHVMELTGDSDRPIFLKVKVMNPAIDLYSRYGFFMKRFGTTLTLVKRHNN
jgi:ribosomal protein S18 acetylase RimI-like enzyme